MLQQKAFAAYICKPPRHFIDQVQRVFFPQKPQQFSLLVAISVRTLGSLLHFDLRRPDPIRLLA